jgi:hypothetical protein
MRLPSETVTINRYLLPFYSDLSVIMQFQSISVNIYEVIMNAENILANKLSDIESIS